MTTNWRFNRLDPYTEPFAPTPPPDATTRAAIEDAVRQFPREGWGPHRLAEHLRHSGVDVSRDMMATVMDEMRAR